MKPLPKELYGSNHTQDLLVSKIEVRECFIQYPLDRHLLSDLTLDTRHSSVQTPGEAPTNHVLDAQVY